MIASLVVKERCLPQDELKPVLELAPITSCNSFLKQIWSRLHIFYHHRHRAQAGVWSCTFWAGRWCLSWEHCTITPPLFGALSCFPHQKPVVPHFFPPPHQERNKGWQSLMARDQGIWGLVYYMLNRALNYWWLLPSLTAFLKREIWANKHVSWKSPCSDRSWQEKKHPGFMTVYY